MKSLLFRNAAVAIVAASTMVVLPASNSSAAGTPLQSVSPARVLETRQGEDTVDGKFEGEGRRDADSTLELDIADRGGVPEGAAAVTLNVTVVNPSTAGFLTIWACNDDKPLAANVNYSAGDVIANAVLAKIADDGTICVFTNAELDLVIDVNGYVPNGGAPNTVVPARLLETRAGQNTVDGDFQGMGRRLAGSTLPLDVAGRGEVPDSADTAVLNVAVVNPATAGFVTVWPCDEDRPLAANVNFTAGGAVGNAVFAKLDADGEVCLYTTAEADLVVDVNGFVADGDAPNAVVPARLLETRVGQETIDGTFQGEGRRLAGSTLELYAANRGGTETGSETVIVNVTAVKPTATGFITIWPCDETRPLAANLTYSAGDIVANAVVAKIGRSGKVCVYTEAETDLVVDVNGYVPVSGDDVDDDSMEQLGRYPVDGNTIVGDVPAAHAKFWNRFAELFAADLHPEVTMFVAIDIEGSGGVDGAMQKNAVRGNGERYLALDVTGGVSQSDIERTMIHEYGHLLTLRESQLDPSGSDSVEDCTVYAGDSCPLPDSYLHAYFTEFWPGFLSADLENEPESAAADRFATGEFVTEYAATIPTEDVAEVFAEWVRAESSPVGDSVLDKKLRFFDDFPEVVAIRDAARAAL